MCLEYAARLASLSALSDPTMVNELKTHMRECNAPTPSVEAIMHAVIPHKYIDHTHSNAILSITYTNRGEEFLRAIYGVRVLYVPNVMIMRIAVLEWSSDGIRINSIHPNAVFDTGIWSPEVIQSRAKSYNLAPEAYMKNKLLRTMVTSPDVAALR